MGRKSLEQKLSEALEFRPTIASLKKLREIGWGWCSKCAELVELEKMSSNGSYCRECASVQTKSYLVRMFGEEGAREYAKTKSKEHRERVGDALKEKQREYYFRVTKPKRQAAAAKRKAKRRGHG